MALNMMLETLKNNKRIDNKIIYNNNISSDITFFGIIPDNFVINRSSAQRLGWSMRTNFD